MMTDEQGQSKEERIGFHKGALSTLAKEREEMSKILGIVEQLMQMHVSALKELGVDLVSQAQSAQANMQQQAPQGQSQVQPSGQEQPQGDASNMEDKLKDWKL